MASTCSADCPARFEYAGIDGVQAQGQASDDRAWSRWRADRRSASTTVHGRRFIDIPFDDMEDYYAPIGGSPRSSRIHAMEVTFKLQPGELFIVDNTRVLHARKAFSELVTDGFRAAMPTRTGCFRRSRRSSDEQRETAMSESQSRCSHDRAVHRRYFRAAWGG